MAAAAVKTAPTVSLLLLIKRSKWDEHHARNAGIGILGRHSPLSR